MAIIKSANEIEFHFQLSGNSHAMDAKILHSCNTAILNILNSLSEILSIPVSIETVALEKGGIRQIWKFIGKNDGQLSLIISVITLALTIFPPSQRLTESEKVNVELQNQKLELEIEQLKKAELGDVINNETIQQISTKHEIAVSRSKYYETLLNYPKVTSVEYSLLDENHLTVEKYTISNNDFVCFIVEKEEYPDEIIDEAVIELIAPVLIDSRYKWKGIYQNNQIDFFMNDDKFKEEIKQGNISFKSGSTIKCQLIIRRKIDEANALKISSYAVDKVFNVEDTNGSYTTIRGKFKRKQEKRERDQLNLFSE